MAKKKTVKLKFKPSFPHLFPVVWQPNPSYIAKDSKHMIGKVMFFLGDIPDVDGWPSGHCVCIYDSKIEQMLHTVDLRPARDDEF